MTIINGDCIEEMRKMPENSVDSIVTDPPYELGFMGKSWDSTGIAFNVEVWKEALRVLKPGGHLLAFSGSRTYHRMAVAIEDAGFEIRDQIMWLYGSGFPKSHNVANAIDKHFGASNRGHAISSGSQIHPTTGEKRANGELLPKYESRTKHSQGWQGWGTALKPAHEPIVLARKPLIGTVASNVLAWGVGGLNIDGSRVASTDNFDGLVGRPIQKLATRLNGETDEEYKARVLESPAQQAALAKLKELGRWPANVIHDGSDEVVSGFPDTAPSKAGIRRNKSGMGIHDSEKGTFGKGDVFGGFDDSGSAARFFYCAKASKRDRNEGLEGFEEKFAPTMNDGIGIKEHNSETATKKQNHHPTVKPTDLMRYLVKLITPPQGIVLDPFMGSGSTGKACAYERFSFIGIEQSPEYCEISKARIAFAVDEVEGEIL